MKLLKYLILLSAFISMSSFAGGFRQISIGSGQLPEQVQSQNLNYVPGNPVTVSGQLTVPNGQTVNELQLTVDVDGHSPEVTSLSVSYGPGNHNFTINSGAVAAGNASISIKALSGSTVLFSNTYGQSASIPDQIGTLLNDPDLITSNLDIASSDLVGVLDSANPIDTDILSNLSDLNAEIDENNHGCALPGSSATGAQGRAYLICVMEAHYADVAAAAVASFTSPSSTQLESCNDGELCGPAPSLCSEAIWTCTVTSSTLPATGTLSPGLNGPANAPASFDGIDITQQLGAAEYSVNLALATYTNPIPNTSFTYSNLVYPSDIYAPPSQSPSGLLAASVVPLVDLSVDITNGFSFVNSSNTLTYSATLSDGTALPSWLSFDGSTGVLTGSPGYATTAPDGTNSFDVAITGTDPQGASATVTQTLNIGTTLPQGAAAVYSSSQAQLNGNNVTIVLQTDPPPAWLPMSESTASITGSKTGWFQTGGAVSERLRASEALQLLDIASAGSNPEGLVDSNGSIVTISDSGGTGTQGYLVVALGHRGDGTGDYGHMVMQLYPLGNAANIASGDALHLPTKPYGIIPDTVSDATGDVLITGTIAIGNTLTADTSGLSDPDGFYASTGYSYQWLANGAAISGATSSTYTIPPSREGEQISVRVSYLDGTYYNEVHTSTQTVAVAGGTLPESYVPEVVTVFNNPSDASTITSQNIEDIGLTNAGIETDIVSNLSDFTAELAENDHGCTISSSPTLSETQTFTECVMRAHYVDVSSAVSTTQSDTPSENTCAVTIQGDLPQFCTHPQWTCEITSSSPTGWTVNNAGTNNANVTLPGAQLSGQNGSPFDGSYTVRASLNIYTPAHSVDYNYTVNVPGNPSGDRVQRYNPARASNAWNRCIDDGGRMATAQEVINDVNCTWPSYTNYPFVSDALSTTCGGKGTPADDAWVATSTNQTNISLPNCDNAPSTFQNISFMDYWGPRGTSLSDQAIGERQGNARIRKSGGGANGPTLKRKNADGTTTEAPGCRKNADGPKTYYCVIPNYSCN